MLPSRSSPCAFRAWVAFIVLFAAGCGRIGLELLPLDDSGDSGVDEPGLDAGEMPGAGDSGVREMPDVCVFTTCASDVDRCTNDPGKVSPGICGCDVSDSADADRDGTPDCNDLCPNAPDVLQGGTCGCPAAQGDDDADGTANCQDDCPDDADKIAPQICGCGITDDDSDGDGMPDCADACPADLSKVIPGSCGCGAAETDTDGDGRADCIDTCNGIDDASYVPDDSCGAGYCRGTNTPSTCVDGVETQCIPGIALSSSDTSCDMVDDDCSGEADEDYVPDATCGLGQCLATNTPSSCSAGVVTACQPGTPTLSSDTTCNNIDEDCSGAADEDYVVDATCGTGYCRDHNTPSSCANGVETACRPGSPLDTNDDTANGVDDDCDGSIDEDVACSNATVNIESDSLALTPPAGCNTATIRIWGGGGGSGGEPVNNGGNGGAGGYAIGTYAVAGTTTLSVRIGGGAAGCTSNRGTNSDTDYNGGNGGSGNAGSGANGAVSMDRGGAGHPSGAGGNGANGDNGGAGGGSGSGTYDTPGNGGAGGAATVVTIDDAEIMVAGGGGGGGGTARGLIYITSAAGGNGGAGCSEPGLTGGTADAAGGGGGGGGGRCVVTGSVTPPVTVAGTGRTPHAPGGAFNAPAGRAVGGNSASGGCQAGGAGYAYVTWSRTP